MGAKKELNENLAEVRLEICLKEFPFDKLFSCSQTINRFVSRKTN